MKQIDLIIDALLVAESSVWSDKIAEALAAARELKALKPVAWMQDSLELYVKDHPTSTYTIPLYTAPLRKPWQGLTEDERNEMIGRIQHDQFTRQRDLIGSTQIITEMYLKGRNT